MQVEPVTGFHTSGGKRRWCCTGKEWGHVTGFHTWRGGEEVMLQQNRLWPCDRVSYLKGRRGGDVTSDIDCGHVTGFHTKWGGEAVMLQGLMRSSDRVSYSKMGRTHGGVLVRSRKPHHRYYFSCSLTSWESLDTAAVSHSWHWAFVYDKFTYYVGQGNGFMLLWSGLMLILGHLFSKRERKQWNRFQKSKIEGKNSKSYKSWFLYW